MKKLTKNQWIAVVIGIALMAFFLYGNIIVNLFTSNTNPAPMNNAASSGVATQDVVVGTGTTAAAGDTVTVHYVGTLENGKVFDSSVDRGQPFSFALGAGQVIRGWDEGVAGMKVGGERKLTIAPDYGYGAQAVGTIPANSVLIFDVKLLGVTKGAAAPTN